MYWKKQETPVDKIPVGHGLDFELSHLTINPSQLRGIRDLCAVLVFETMGIIQRENFKD